MALTFDQNHRTLPRRLLRREARSGSERWSPRQSTLFVIATSSLLWLAIILSLLFAF